jgi:hypothetical protein
MDLKDILATLGAIPEKERKELEALALSATKSMCWVPNPGPQTDAYFSPADELFYGGQAGGGKSDLIVGLALNEHDRSLILRRTNKEALGFVERIAEILGSRDGYNGQNNIWRTDGHAIDIGGCQLEEDKQKYKGNPHSLIAFDEVSDFTETQYVFISGWNRSANPKQRCRVVATGNPPTRPEGLWVLKRWGAWLDPAHPNPARPGELRWYLHDENGDEIEVDGRGPHMIGGRESFARSRTFIPAQLSDNPDLAATGYASVLDSLPEELRRAYRDGDFTASLKDDDFQLLPTAWVRAAQARWKPDGFKDYNMTAMALDPAGGGSDAAALAFRYSGWYAPIAELTGPETADGSKVAGMVITHRRNSCPVVVDVGGGYGGAPMMRLKDNGVTCIGFNGAGKSTARAVQSGLEFHNKRAEACWRFREALDPDQEGGSIIALPPDPELVADLCAYKWIPDKAGILIESKDHMRQRLGRSPNKGDAVIMCLSEGQRAVMRRTNLTTQPKVNVGYPKVRRR